MQYNENKAKMRAMREEFETMLKSTGRDGVDDCLAEIQQLGFFDAPASTRFHLNYEGGLMEHSLNVAKTALRLREQMIGMDESLKPFLPEDSVIIASLLHDVCKADIYKPAVKRVKQPDGSWADEPGYDVDFSAFPMGHGEKSVVVLLLSGIALTNDEMLAIRWHMAAWDLAFNSTEAKSNINAARDICPLCSLVQAADTLAANLLERKK
ncbi:MAG: HD domain-containing protein [Marinilabiliaceae bacterium]